MRGILIGLPLSAALWLGAFGVIRAFAGLDVPPAPAPDMSGYATKSDISGFATMDAMSSALNAAQTAQGAKQSSIPTTGPGPGLCRLTVVPSNLVSSGGVAGTAGTCSRIVQCGTSADYVVTQFNVGSGC